MPKTRKQIHSLFSPKFEEKRKRVKENSKKIQKDGVEAPASVDNFRVNKPLFGPHKIKAKQTPIVARKISKTEGAPTVNKKSGKSVEKLIHKPVPKSPSMSPDAGAIEAESKPKPKRRGRKPKAK